MYKIYSKYYFGKPVFKYKLDCNNIDQVIGILTEKDFKITGQHYNRSKKRYELKINGCDLTLFAYKVN